MMELIGIDNGHGYNTAGKRTPDGTMREWEFNYATAKYLKEELEANGFRTLMLSDTREDTSLAARTKKANDARCSLVISIHANALNGTWGTHGGVETFAFKPGVIGDKIANHVQAKLASATCLRNRGVKYNNLHMTRETNMPSILVECGFMDNREEAALLKSDEFRRKCAKAIAQGLCNYYSIQYKGPSEKKLYAVCVGAYQLETAVKMKNELVGKGYKDTYLIER